MTNTLVGSGQSVKRLVASSVVTVLKFVSENRPPKCLAVPVEQEGEIETHLRALIGTKTGLCLLKEGRVTRLFEGRTYGIVRHNDRWYAATNRKLTIGSKPLSTVGQLLSFTLKGKEARDLRVELSDLSNSIHEMVVWNDRLLLADTPSNRIMEFAFSESGLVHAGNHYPAGRLGNGRESENYVHLNSFYPHPERLSVLFHNDSVRTSRNSVIAELDQNFSLVDQREVSASCAHNLVMENNEWCFLDSHGGALMRGSERLFQDNCFLRGLARIDSGWIVGGSDFSPREYRKNSTGFVTHIDHEGRRLGKLTLPGIGSVYEIRVF